MTSPDMSSNDAPCEKCHLTDIGKFWIAYLFFLVCLLVSLLNLVTAGSLLDTPLGYISGFLLLLAAYLIRMMRRPDRQVAVGANN
jgi:uncharacterized membrane protein